MKDVAATHRALYDAVETGDVDLMGSLWTDDPNVTCVHPGSEPLRGTETVLRSWTLLMANVGYIQFFLTDVDVTLLPAAGETASAAVVTCTENILSDDGADSRETFVGGKAVCTSVLIRDGSGWKFWSRHASPVLEVGDDQEDG